MGADKVYSQLTTDLQRKIFQKLVTSEVAGPKNENVAYSLQHAGTTNSAYSYGWIQYDMGQDQPNPEATKIISDAIKNIGVSKDIQNQLIEGLATKGTTNALVEQYKNVINAQLKSEVFSDRIDDATVWSIQNTLEKRVTDVIAQVQDTKTQSFLQNSLIAQLFIADLRNQFGDEVNNKFEKYLNGKEVTPNQDGGLPVQVNGDFGLEDLVRYHLSTNYAQNGVKLGTFVQSVLDIGRRWSTLASCLGQHA